jgi:AraC-like DNA-binding protein
MLSRSSDVVTNGLTLDPLSEVLQDLRPSGVSYGRCELTRPWGIDFPPQSAARFHFVAAGECWLHTPSLGWIPLHSGDVVLLPRGTGHALADTANGQTKPIEGFPLEEVGDKIGDATLPVLPDTMAGEVLAQRVGAATVLTRLADVVITRVVRAWVEARSEDATGWLAAIRDPKIGRALAAIHRRPGHHWSVEALADIAHVSRSMFSERFVSVVGVPPARYVSRWRMHLASVWLRNERRTVSEVAARLGYESEASFSRAFKRSAGVAPSTLRRRDPAIAEIAG